MSSFARPQGWRFVSTGGLARYSSAAPSRRAPGYGAAATVTRSQASKRSSRLLAAAVGNGKRLRAKVTVGFRDRGDTVARKHAWVTLVPRG